jgi:hypothetical protein
MKELDKNKIERVEEDDTNLIKKNIILSKAEQVKMESHDEVKTMNSMINKATQNNILFY